ncbi:MAG TPA: TonB-dependent receptor [Terriglobales bacterium]|nr:TonB-dependent receptor [Terriglobales bacterium]
MRFARLIFPLVCLSFLTNILLAQSVGTIQGTITDPSGAVVANASVNLSSAISGYKQTTTTNATGFYKFTGVPFVTFTVHAEAPGFAHVDTTAELRSNVPLTLNLSLAVQASTQVVDVTESAAVLETSSASTHHDLDYMQLQKSPVVGSGRGVEALVQTVPGVVQDDNGRMHPRGSESQVQYVVDGVPVTDNISSAFGSALDPRNLRSAEVITGSVPAEYGGKLGAVINVNTKSGLEMPWNGNVSLTAGSFDSREVGGEFGGHTQKVGVYVSATGSRSRRYLDPPEIQNFRNLGGTGRLFSKFDWNVDPKNILRLSLSLNGSNVQVPNRFDQELAGQRQKQALRDDSQSLGWNHIFNERTVTDVVIYRRSSTSRLLDPGFSGVPYYAEQARRQRTEGVRASISYSWKQQDLKAGFLVVRTPLREGFVIAATDPAILGDQLNPASQFTVVNPFRFNQRLNGLEASLFVQDRVTFFDRLTVDAGIRFDHYDVVVNDNAISPRIGVAYHFKRTGTVLRGAYNRLFQTPPNENLLLSSSSAGAVFSPLAATGVRAVPPERQNLYEYGVQQQIGKYVRLDISRYIKNIRNFSDKDQFLDTPIIFPVAIARGDIRGLELRLDVIPIHGWTAFVSYANSRATGTTPLAGGLFLDEASSALLVPGNKFAADHDQRNTGQFGVTYTHKSGAWINFSGRHDSGVPAEVDPAALSGLDARIVASLDAVRGRVKPRSLFDFATGYEWMRERRYPISLQFSVQNLSNEFYLYNFESVFSGTHIGRPREVSGRIVFHFKGKGGAGSAD